MTDGMQQTPQTARERFHEALVEKASAVKCVRNDVFTVKYWQLALNFVLGGGAVALMILSMVFDGAVSMICLAVAAGLAVIVAVYNLLMRARVQMSFLQYTARDGDRRYCYRILNKNRSLFTDGENVIEFDRGRFLIDDGLEYPQYRFDFFADMDATVRIGKPDREIYKGTLDCGGKTLRCKIVFKNGAPFYGTVGGARIKYFDVNDTKEKFVVPQELIDAIKAANVAVPKLAGVTVKAAVNAVKQ